MIFAPNRPSNSSVLGRGVFQRVVQVSSSYKLRVLAGRCRRKQHRDLGEMVDVWLALRAFALLISGPSGQRNQGPATIRKSNIPTLSVFVHGHQLGSVRVRSLDLHIVNHPQGTPFDHLRNGPVPRTRLHQVGDGAAVGRALENEIGDQRDRFGMIELDAGVRAARRATMAATEISSSFSRGAKFITEAPSIRPILRQFAQRRHNMDEVAP